jgi:ribosomal protein L11 methyltransferase
VTNSWWEIEISSHLSLEETIFWRLEQFGCRGTATETKNAVAKIKTYIPVVQAEISDLAVLSQELRQDASLGEFPPPLIFWQIVYEEDWASSWKQHWQPQEIGSKLLIYPAWLPLPATTERSLLRLDPGMAFGTGTHQTTQLCLEALEKHLESPAPDTIIADLGCGSGILGIAALILGADRVYAVDTDPLAVTATHANRELNQIDSDRLLVETGSIDKLQQMIPRPVDGFVCNILAEVIIELIPDFEKITQPNAWGSLSGIIGDRLTAVTEVLEHHNWELVSVSRRQDWCCLHIQRH